MSNNKDFVESYNREAADFLVNKMNEFSLQSKNTSGHKKLVQYFEEVIKSDYFLAKVKSIRKKYA